MGMTITKQYIELSDVLAVVVMCGGEAGCKASLSIPMVGNRMTLPLNCPNCGAVWSEPIAGGGTSRPPSKAERLAIFFEAFRQLKQSFDPSTTLRFDIAPRKEGL
jgi:hypothetical protein